MSIKGKLRILEGGMVSFWCEGCEMYHGVTIDKTKSPSWDFNGDYEKPTFSPSIRVRIPHPEGYSIRDTAPVGWNGKVVDHICHSFITDGEIQYLSDSTHELAGWTIDLKQLEDEK